MRRCFRSLALALSAGCAAQPQPDVSDVTGARGMREVTGTTYGAPLPGITAKERQRFDAGLAEFMRRRNPGSGLGPVMTADTCSACHDSPPAIGGTNQRLETRFGLRTPDGSFDPLLSSGGPMLQDESIGTVNGFAWARETLPPAATVVAQRRTTPVFGLGLVDATPDATFAALAEWQRAHHPELAGRPARVRDLVSGADAVGRFGWKASQPTLLQFTADAFVNEMGITTPLFPDENCPQGDCASLANNPSPGVNDPEGSALASATDFMKFLGPPPRAGAPPTRGGEVFAGIGCAVCHLQTLVTGPSASFAVDRVAYHPFSDFLLHDMGTLGDGIDQGGATGGEMRTAPLWGLPLQRRLLHDGRATTIAEAILAHDGQGKTARDRFAALQDPDRADLLVFLESL
jgi:CxxC motif-containing protein (DUF1111 family)